MSIAVNPIREAAFAAGLPEVRAEALPLAWPRRLTLCLLVAAPLGFGATGTLGGLVLTGAAWIAFLTWVVSAVRAERMEWHSRNVLLPGAVLLAFTAVHWAAGISANPSATQLDWLRWVGIFCAGFVAAESFLTAAQLRGLCATLAIAGFAVALFGIVQYLTGNGKIYWMVEPAQNGWIFGPYVNRNHFAGLMALWMPLALGLALMPDNTFLRRWLWCAAAIVMAAAVALSGSRGGLVAIGVEVTMIAFVAASWHGRRTVIALGASAAIVVLTVGLLGRGELLERYQQTLQFSRLNQEESAAYRVQAWKGAVEIFRQHPVMGTGLDTFATHFPAVRTFSTDKIWSHAHNDYLQFAAETGLIGLALGGWLAWAGARAAWRNLKHNEGTATGALLLGIVCACIGFAVHGLMDFNFHVPANAANFAALGAVLARPGWDED